MTEHEKNLNQKRITEQSDTQIARREYNKLRNHDKETGLIDNGNNYLPTQNQSVNNYRNYEEYKIPVRIQGTTEGITLTNDDFFLLVYLVIAQRDFIYRELILNQHEPVFYHTMSLKV